MTHAAKHTPGPWEHKGNRIYRKDSYAVAWIEGQGPQTEWQANGKLIAAAPAMYEALQDIVEGLTDEITRMVEGDKPATARLDYLANKAGLALAQAEGAHK